MAMVLRGIMRRNTGYSFALMSLHLTHSERMRLHPVFGQTGMRSEMSCSVSTPGVYQCFCVPGLTLHGTVYCPSFFPEHCLSALSRSHDG